MKPRNGDRSWFDGSSRTWRWNEGTYEERGSYDAVEASPTGLSWYHWDHWHGDGGAQAREQQTFAAFTTSGPARNLPERVHAELQQWLVERGHITKPSE